MHSEGLEELTEEANVHIAGDNLYLGPTSSADTKLLQSKSSPFLALQAYQLQFKDRKRNEMGQYDGDMDLEKCYTIQDPWWFKLSEYIWNSK